MAHWAKVLNGVVQKVIVAEPEFFETFVDDSPGVWLQTSYNTIGGVHTLGGTPFRKNFAGVGYTYDAQRDAFIAPKPFDSWTLDEFSCQWKCPVDYPKDGKLYSWDESKLAWIAEGNQPLPAEENT